MTVTLTPAELDALLAVLDAARDAELDVMTEPLPALSRAWEKLLTVGQDD